MNGFSSAKGVRSCELAMGIKDYLVTEDTPSGAKAQKGPLRMLLGPEFPPVLLPEVFVNGGVGLAISQVTRERSRECPGGRSISALV